MPNFVFISHQKAIEIVDKALPVLKNQKISFLNGDSGPLALAAVLHKANNEHKVAEQLVTRFVYVFISCIHNNRRRDIQGVKKKKCSQ